MIDAHHHFLLPGRYEYPWITDAEERIDDLHTPADLEPLLRANGVDRTVVVQTLPSIAESLDLLAFAVDHRWIAGVVGWVDLTGPEVAEQIETLKAAPGGDRLVGIRHDLTDEPDPGWVLAPAVMSGLGAVAAAGLSYDLEVGARELPATREAVRLLPDLQFVLDHGGKPPIASGRLDFWKLETAALAELPNVACKCSGLVTEANRNAWTQADLRPVVEHLVGVFGAERIMFGSDWPVCNLASDYATVVDMTRSLCGPSWRRVSGQTALEVYQLPPKTAPSGLSDSTLATPS